MICVKTTLPRERKNMLPEVIYYLSIVCSRVPTYLPTTFLTFLSIYDHNYLPQGACRKTTKLPTVTLKIRYSITNVYVLAQYRLFMHRENPGKTLKMASISRCVRTSVLHDRLTNISCAARMFLSQSDGHNRSRAEFHEQ